MTGCVAVRVAVCIAACAAVCVALRVAACFAVHVAVHVAVLPIQTIEQRERIHLRRILNQMSRNNNIKPPLQRAFFLAAGKKVFQKSALSNFVYELLFHLRRILHEMSRDNNIKSPLQRSFFVAGREKCVS